mmetsp:Transcript_35677/g.87790  ORF Transcript_35677/g.87790 Transcript_35677/m.87790 type:complete len:361 (-) Transcript_35677:185-1267(-)
MRLRSAVAVVESDRGECHLVVSPVRSIDTHVIRVCGTTGALEYGRVPGLDVWPSEAAAIAHLRARGLCKQATHGCALLGCATFGDTAVVLMAKKVRAAVVMPNGHEVLTVVEAQWLRVPLRNPAAVLTREERTSVQSLTEIPLENLYFYCETFDVTRAFAHSASSGGDGGVGGGGDRAGGGVALATPEREWVWNEWLSAPLRALGIAGACPALLQGLAESRRLKDAEGRDFHLVVFGRRSCLHPGTRYLARGLNASAAPGNEVEMEQLVWRAATAAAAGGGGGEGEGANGSGSGNGNVNGSSKNVAGARASAGGAASSSSGGCAGAGAGGDADCGNAVRRHRHPAISHADGSNRGHLFSP